MNKFLIGAFYPIGLILIGFFAISIALLPIIVMLALDHDSVWYGVANIVWLMVLSGIIYSISDGDNDE